MRLGCEPCGSDDDVPRGAPALPVSWRVRGRHTGGALLSRAVPGGGRAWPCGRAPPLAASRTARAAKRRPCPRRCVGREPWLRARRAAERLQAISAGRAGGCGLHVAALKAQRRLSEDAQHRQSSGISRHLAADPGQAQEAEQAHAVPPAHESRLGQPRGLRSHGAIWPYGQAGSRERSGLPCPGAARRRRQGTPSLAGKACPEHQPSASPARAATGQPVTTSLHQARNRGLDGGPCVSIVQSLAPKRRADFLGGVTAPSSVDRIFLRAMMRLAWR